MFERFLRQKVVEDFLIDVLFYRAEEQLVWPPPSTRVTGHGVETKRAPVGTDRAESTFLDRNGDYSIRAVLKDYQLITTKVSGMLIFCESA